MLDAFEILTTSGIVLWSRSNIDVSSNVVNSLINDVFIEERVRPASSQVEETSSQRNPAYRHDKYTLKWTLVKDLGLIFVVWLVSSSIVVLIFNARRLSTNRSCT